MNSFALRRTIIFAALALNACASVPDQWALDVAGRLGCGMTEQQVEEISGRKLKVCNRDWCTHFLGGDTEVSTIWLVFENHRLRSTQIAWMKKYGFLEEQPRRDLCN